MSSQNNVLKIILSCERTVFTMQFLVMKTGISDGTRLSKMLNYYVKKGEIRNPRRGIYTKIQFQQNEMACSIFHPSYISLEYVLCQAGVIFQYDHTITSVSYLSRTVEVEGIDYSFRQINPELWGDLAGIEQKDNICVATPERALLDMMYLSAGKCYFDNLRPINTKKINKLLPYYKSETLIKNVHKLLNL